MFDRRFDCPPVQSFDNSKEWVALYRDGTVHKWLDQVTHFYVGTGAIKQPVPAEKYFDTKPYRGLAAS